MLKRWVNWAVRKQCRREYDRQQLLPVNERPIEYAFLFRSLTRAWPKSVLDVGTGQTSLPHLIRTCGFVVTATDNVKDYWPSGMTNRHFHVIDDDITRTKLDRTFDFVSCISVLEHIRDHAAAVNGMWSLLNPGGHLLLSFPYNEKTFVENAYDLPGTTVKEKMPFVTHVYSRKEVDGWLSGKNASIVEQEYWRFFTGEFWTVGERVAPPEPSRADGPHHVTCILIRKDR